MALLAAFARSFTIADSAGAIDATGLTPDQADQARHALVNSASFKDALSSLDADLGARVTQAVVDAFSSGVARTMMATAALALIITVVVAFVWPRRAAITTTAPSRP